MSCTGSSLLAAVLFACLFSVTESVLTAGRRPSLRASVLDVNATAFQNEIGNAMGEALGCGGQYNHEQLEAIERVLIPMWRALPKRYEDNVDSRSLRSVVFRYFNRRFRLHVRGFEPSVSSDGSGWSEADILSQRVPDFVESVLTSQHRSQHGFSLRDAAYMVATLDQLIFDSESTLLERIYKNRKTPETSSLSSHDLGELLEDYMVHWLMAGDSRGVRKLLANRTLLARSFPHWADLVRLIRGDISTWHHRRQFAPREALVDASSRSGHNALEERYSFDDAHRVVGGLTKSFGSYLRSECATLNDQLIAMDTHKTGRVPLSTFYGTGMGSERRFGESESYLRELGALDETTRGGAQVIIPNYVQGASNCIVATAHYLVCCRNECEDILEEIEDAFESPMAEPSKLVDLVKGVTVQAALNDDFPTQVDSEMIKQLHQIASLHGGKVPLYGRLFAQWLHYIFPRECPYPHRTGTTKAVAPLEFSGDFVATREQMIKHANTTGVSVNKTDGLWMSQWSSEEEELIDFTIHAPWETSHFFWSIALLLVAGFIGISGLSSLNGSGQMMLLPTHKKSHFV